MAQIMDHIMVHIMDCAMPNGYLKIKDYRKLNL